MHYFLQEVSMAHLNEHGSTHDRSEETKCAFTALT